PLGLDVLSGEDPGDVRDVVDPGRLVDRHPESARWAALAGEVAQVDAQFRGAAANGVRIVPDVEAQGVEPGVVARRADRRAQGGEQPREAVDPARDAR